MHRVEAQYVSHGAHRGLPSGVLVKRKKMTRDRQALVVANDDVVRAVGMVAVADVSLVSANCVRARGTIVGGGGR